MENLKQINSSLLKRSDNGIPQWFSSDDADFFIILNEKGIFHFEINLSEYILEGGLEKPLKYGKIKENTEIRYDLINRSRTVEYTKEIPAPFLDQCHQVLRSCIDLDPQILKSIQSFIDSNGKNINILKIPTKMQVDGIKKSTKILYHIKKRFIMIFNIILVVIFLIIVYYFQNYFLKN